MTVIDIDRHVLAELAVLQDKMVQASREFKVEWEEIIEVRALTAMIVINQKDVNSAELPKLRERITRAMRVCNTKMIVIDDAMSRQGALLQHLTTEAQKDKEKAQS